MWNLSCKAIEGRERQRETGRDRERHAERGRDRERQRERFIKREREIHREGESERERGETRTETQRLSRLAQRG